MKLKAMQPVRWPYVVLIMLLPLLIAAFFLAGMAIYGTQRYNDAYFMPTYQQRYDSPGAVIRPLEHALQTGNSQLYAELTGLRHAPPALQADPNLSFVMLIEIDKAHYYHYLFFDEKTMTRMTVHIKEVKGRWVVVPDDLYFYYDSGRWLSAYLPIAGVWWAVWIIVWLLQMVSSVSACYRREHLDTL